MSNRAYVLQRYPRSFARLDNRQWYIYAPTGSGSEKIGRGVTRPDAWADAAKLVRFRLNVVPADQVKGSK